MTRKVRVRFAPSPTGPLHIGGVRTALFNYLFAKKNGGDFVLRIEDTDQTRYIKGAESYIIDSLNWLQIRFDEGPGKEGDYGPYRQSERKHIYKKYAQELISKGLAYYAFDTSDELDTKRKECEIEGKTFIYNWHNRLGLINSLSLSKDEVQARIDRGDDYVIRFKSPDHDILHLKDIVRGSIEIETYVLDDKVLFKSDGMPTYHLANVVDDHLMEITHVIRGEEWLPSLALHVLLYKAFEWELPEFAHLPLIMKPEGKGKLSKRDGDLMGFPVFPLKWDSEDGSVFAGYREDGYLPEAVVNMLAFLGWNPGTEKEIFSLTELITEFELERVNKSGAKFDPEKTKWYQHYYLQKMNEADLIEQFRSLLKEKNISPDAPLKKIVPLLKERATFLNDLWEQGSFFFEAPKVYDEKAAAKAFKPGTKEILETVYGLLTNSEDFSTSVISKTVKDWITVSQLGIGSVMMPLRLSLVGEMKGPDVFEIASILGKEESLKRIQKAIDFLS